MPIDSWIVPDDVAVLAAQAKERIDASLARLDEAQREAFWASIRKCYNTPYNDPKPRKLVRSEGLTALQRPLATEAPTADSREAGLVSLLVMTPPAGFGAEQHAG